MRPTILDKLGLSAKSTKTPWFLRWPAAIRRRINQWNWRKKTALVTALAITAGGTFAYQYRANAAWPLILTVAGGTDFLIKVFSAYGITQGLNAAFNSDVLKETVVADSDTWLYSKRKLRVRDYEYDEGGNRTLAYSVDAQAEANQLKAYDTSGTDTKRSPSALDPDDVLDYVGSNANLRIGRDVTYAVLVLRNGSWVPLFTWDRRKPEIKYLETYTDTYGGYVKPLTDVEIQEDLDNRRRVWNLYGRGRYTLPGSVGPLKKGHVVGRVYNTYTCEKEVKLWSDFEHVAVPGGTGLSPTELEDDDGHRSTYVTRFSYKAREAGFIYNIRTRTPLNAENEKFTEYPEPMSWCDDNFKRFTLTEIEWGNFKIIDTPAWVGRAKRFFKYKKTYNYCTKHNTKHAPRRGRHPCRLAGHYTTLHEYPVYQNENVKKPSN